MKRGVAVIFLIVIETVRKNSAFDATDSTYSGKLLLGTSS